MQNLNEQKRGKQTGRFQEQINTLLKSTASIRTQQQIMHINWT
jgi:hypothetical protein